MLKTFKLIESKKKSKISTYEDFLKKIDESSREKLYNLDAMISVFKDELKNEGFEFNEYSCLSPNIRIFRNQMGFYVDESKSLNSWEEYHFYQMGVAFYNKFKDKFVQLDKLLREKEDIMNGNYQCKYYLRKALSEFSSSFGYGIVRKNKLYEEVYDHPSLEYRSLSILLELVKKESGVDKKAIINKCLTNASEYLKDGFHLEIKHISDKYGTDFDNSFGILVIDDALGEMNMLYEVDGLRVIKAPYNKYFTQLNVYLDIYFRIISYCLKEELIYNFKEKVV